jgi:two-component system, response regulator FlrC
MVRRDTDSASSRRVATVERWYNRPAVRILLVDDDPSATRLYRTMLANEGHEVVVLDSGIDAVEAAEREPFDLVITDFHMPGIKGDVTLSLLRARLPDLPVVIMTSEPSPAVEKRARDAGAAAFLHKPCSAELLARTIARVCKKP